MILPRSEREDNLLREAARYLPGGVLGDYRFPPELAFVVSKARGARLWDASGREYIDFQLGGGPLILGHAPPVVVQAVKQYLDRGTTYFLVNEPIIELAEELVRAVPCAEQVRFTSTGSEATLFALRLARAFRKRDKILKFEGAYHGSHDYVLMSVGPRAPKAFPSPVPDSAGIPGVITDNVLIAPYNDLATTQEIIAANADQLGAVIVEPLQRVIPPVPGFLEGLRDVTADYGIPLVFDEVVTGFRLAYGGAQEYYGVTPDLAVYAKTLGGGFPLGAVAGREAIMRACNPDLADSEDFVSQLGTLSGNPISAVAALATLRELKRPGTYERLHRIGNRLKDSLAHYGSEGGFTLQVVGDAPVFDVFFGDCPIRNYRDLLRADRSLKAAFNHELLRRGTLKAPQKFYVSLAHTEDDIDRAVETVVEAFQALARSRDAGGFPEG